MRARARGPQQSRGRFDSQRLAEVDEVEGPIPEEEPEEESEDEMDSDDEDDEESAQNAQPYMSLMRSLVESAPHKAKRRKLDHSSTEESAKRSKTKPASNDVDMDGEPQDGDADLVDEPEEAPEEIDAPEEVAPEDLFDLDDNLDTTDPFETHISAPDDAIVQPRLRAIKAGNWRTERVTSKGTRIQVNVPNVDGSDGWSMPAPVNGIADLKLKKKLDETLSKKHATFDLVEQTIAPFLFDYQDVLYCNRTVASADSARRITCLHALNHILKTRDRVIKNNARLAKDNGNVDVDISDQGFTRPKVLILLPTRNSCVKMVDMLCSLCEPDAQEHRKRFDDTYVEKDTRFSDDKPDDFRDLFAGNDDDMFRLGMKFMRKNVKYFSQFYNSDIIFASPLGLRMAIGSEEEEKKVDYDFLSSIELVIVDQADALLMQNWEHVEYIFEHLNLQPKDMHDADIGRIRRWYLDNNAKFFRQTVILSAFNTPELTELVRTQCFNFAGKARLQQECPGVIQYLGVKARQTFSRFDAKSIAADPDARFSYFTKAIIPMLTKRAKDATGTLIFIPSYLDFVRVRNYFANSSDLDSVTFGTISEYADVPEASRARSHFLNGRHRVLLYTERAHHFRRYQIKGVKRVIMYGLPDNPIFYREITGGYLQKSEQALMLEPGQGTVKVMFSKYDVMKLERVVGTQRAAKMISEQGDTFDFV
ncbi:hypothetical protein B0T17DRAFT_612470 [Bombardia bombarda]|uniref:U3 small nucleolar RNA-associated protein 25 n=1 Tax=Bombardia bombarda TaxID=252184 RepID=A0AA39XKF9_9PEZI|nr:hypothetical protein B0T17DRAFT_612470 [Bombardia bombarda]